MPPKLSIERFAALRADIERESDLERVLESADILRSEWSQLEKHWQTELAREVAAGRSELSERYLAAFFAGSAAEQPAAPAPIREGKAPAQIFVPSYLMTARAAPPAPAPLTSPPPLAVPTSLQQPPAMMPKPAAPPVAPASISVKADPKATVFLPDGDAPPAAKAALPFGNKRAATPPAVNATFVDDGSHRRASQTLPFEGENAPPPAQPVVPSVGTGTELLADGTETNLSGPAVPDGLPSLTVDQYAWMTATLKRTPPDELGAALSRLRLTAASRERLQAIWSAHMAANPPVKAAYVRAFAAQFDAAHATSAPGRVGPPQPSSPPLPMSIEQFAALQSSLTGRSDRDAVLRSHGIDPARWSETLRQFGDAMKTDPALRSQYERAIQAKARR